MDKFTIYLFTWVVFSIIIIFILGISAPHTETIEIVDCYDEYRNLMIGLQCEDKILNYTLYDPFVVMTTICFISIIGMIGISIKHWND